MNHGTCVTHVLWCMPRSLTSGFLWSRWRGKCSRHSRCMRSPQLYVSGKMPIPLKTESYHDANFVVTCGRYRRLSLWQPAVPPMTTKFASWRPLFSVTVFLCNSLTCLDIPLCADTNSQAYFVPCWTETRRVYTCMRALSVSPWWRLKWKHFLRYWSFVRESTALKGQWRGALMFSLICAWRRGKTNSLNTGDLRRHVAHCGVTVVKSEYFMCNEFEFM